MATPNHVDEGSPSSGRMAWLSVFLAAWIVGGLFLAVGAYTSGVIGDSVVSIYHLPFYLGVLALAATCGGLLWRARRAGRNLRSAFPSGYGVLLAGAAVLLAWPVIEIGWRQGIGIGPGATEQTFAPSRVMVFAGCLLVASAPLWAASRHPAPAGTRWAPAASAALVFAVLGVTGIEPAQNAWLEAPRNDPQSQSEIWVMDADGSHQTRLIVGPDGYAVGNAVWSPDGKQIAYTVSQLPERMGPQPADTSIWLAAADGTNPRRLIDGTGWYWLPHWSPDGSWITFTIDAQHGPGSGAGVLPPAGAYGQPPAQGQPAAVTPSVDIWRVRADGTGGLERLSTDPAEDRAAVYAPDGQHLLFDSTRAEGRTALYVAAADGSNATRLTALGDDWGGAWSPDGTRVVFNASPSGAAYDIYVTAYPASGAPTQLTSDMQTDVAPSWSPDGRRICFVSSRADGKNDIWSMAADGSDQVNLTKTAGAAEDLTSGGGAWGPDGRILFERAQDVPAAASDLVRQGLGVADALLGALLLALLVIVLVGVGSPFGAVTLLMGVAAVAVAVGNGEWRFVPAAIVGGLLVDAIIRLAPDHRKALFGAAAAAAMFIVAAGATVIATSVLGWTPGLLIGVVMMAALMGAGAALLRRPAVGVQADDAVG